MCAIRVIRQVIYTNNIKSLKLIDKNFTGLKVIHNVITRLQNFDYTNILLIIICQIKQYTIN